MDDNYNDQPIESQEFTDLYRTPCKCRCREESRQVSGNLCEMDQRLQTLTDQFNKFMSEANRRLAESDHYVGFCMDEIYAMHCGKKSAPSSGT